MSLSKPLSPVLSLQQSLNQFAGHIRDPKNQAAPANIEDRRMAIYRDLFFNNIEGFVAGAFPILKSITHSDEWHAMIRDFMVSYRTSTPYFLEIAEEFLNYIKVHRMQGDHIQDPPFMLELAHYEWAELALDVALADIPEDALGWPGEELLNKGAQVSPLAWCLSYSYPVHNIGPNFQPNCLAAAPTFLIVYRNRADSVEFMAANTVTFRLLQLIQSSGNSSLIDILSKIAVELETPLSDSFLNHGRELLQQLYRLDIISSFYDA